jgi:phage N-6-adenine-methyltransferase
VAGESVVGVPESAEWEDGMNPHDQRVIHSSQESDWRTPPECFVALQHEFGFMVDAAADPSSALCPTWFGPGSAIAEDGLSAAWAGTIFLNPPYSRTKARAWTGTGPNPYRIEQWAKKCWEESQRGCTIVGLFPFAPQTDWYRRYVYGHTRGTRLSWEGHAAKEERRLPHRISFLRPDGSPAANAGVNTAVIVWTPIRGAVGPWQPFSWYWSWK